MNPLIKTSDYICSSILFVCAAISIVSCKSISTLVATLNGETVRPRLKVKVNTKEFSWLYDTGAARTCISTAMYKHMFPNGLKPSMTKLFTPGSLKKLKLSDAGGNSLGLFGIFPMTMTILGKTFTHEVWVCDKITDLIIGIDLIHKFHLGYDTYSRSVQWQTEPINSVSSLTKDSVLSLTKRCHFPALSTSIVKTKFKGHFEPFATLIATIFCPSDELLTGGPALVSLTDDGFCTVAITNCAPYDIVVQRGSIIGLIETEGQHSLIEQLSDSKVKDICNSINLVTSKIGEQTAFLTREQIVAKVKLQVPAEFKEQYTDLLFKNREAISISSTDLGKAKKYFHKIHLKDNSPVYGKQFKIPEAHSDFIGKTIDDWLKLGVVRRSNSMYNSPIFCVPKKNGNGLRIVQDFRELNQHSHIDKYSMKEINECIGDIGRANSTIFSTLDLTSGFWQMPLHPNDSHLTAFTVPSKGQFEWITSPMGLLGCPASFQRLMESVMRNIIKVIVYIDDLLVHSQTHEEQLLLLQQVFDRLIANGLKINLEKCVFGNNEVSYLGFTLTPNGISPGKDKLKCIRDASPPTDIKMV